MCDHARCSIYEQVQILDGVTNRSADTGEKGAENDIQHP